ncbi:hypothetical protein MnTg01_00144 [archaeon MnTg01]|nr:hypothetical protein MnTg01_00144 [archaeon MnTg01]
MVTTKHPVMRNIIGLFIVLSILIIMPSLQYALAQGDEAGEYLDRRVVIWNLFFRMMTVAFVIGAVVSGTLIWLIWRFRESHPKATPTKYEGTGALDE